MHASIRFKQFWIEVEDERNANDFSQLLRDQRQRVDGILGIANQEAGVVAPANNNNNNNNPQPAPAVAPAQPAPPAGPPIPAQAPCCQSATATPASCSSCPCPCSSQKCRTWWFASCRC
ncbi:hypothetical protein PSTG_19857 [Puccinia striiformis f. sp. tritici PST-78]|nr:hypothetical protein PSTG_19857 [Puccinia striiformis f. sp. tritici PST-78]